MRMLIVALSFVSTLSFADAKFYTDPFRDISDFLDLPEKVTQIFQGKTAQGQSCRLGISKWRDRVVFSPLDLPGAPAIGVTPTDARHAMAFIVRDDSVYDVSGGTEGNHLWASYFIDDRTGDFVIPGQFAMHFRLDLKTDGRGGFTEAQFSKVHMQDLGFALKGRMQCKDLRRL